MQEINLLQNKIKDRTLQYERSNRVVLVIFSLIVVLEMAAVGGLIYLTNNTNSQTAQVTNQSQSIQSAMNSSQSDLASAKGLQAQLKNVNTILSNRIYWTSFLDQFSAVVPANVQIESINGDSSDNSFQVQALAPSYADIGRFILSLSTSGKFQNLKLGTISPASGTTTGGFSFTVGFKASNSLFTK